MGRYVGFTTNPVRRKRDHSSKRIGNTGSAYGQWRAKLLAEGVVPVFIVLEEGVGVSVGRAAEAYWAATFPEGSLVNSAKPGSVGPVGVKWTPEVRSKMVVARSAVSYSHPHTDEYKDSLRALHAKLHHREKVEPVRSEASRARTSEALKRYYAENGTRKATEAAKKKVSDAVKRYRAGLPKEEKI